MASEFIVKNGLIVGGTVVTSGTITINGALAATQTWVGSQGYLTSASLSGYATQSYVTSAIAALVDSAPAALDTLNELAAALGDDASFSTTITNSIAGKVAKSGDTMTGDLTLNYGYPRINFYDSGHNPDYSLINNDGDFSLYDITNNVHRLWVSATGNVGIGNTSPNDKLDVSGNVSANAFNAVGTLARYNGTGGVAIAGLGGSSYAYISAYSDSGGTGKNLALQKDGGNVGIGTTSPAYKLHVSTGNTNVAARLENTTSNGSVLELYSSGDGRLMTFQTDHIYINSGALHFGAENGALYLRSAGYGTVVGGTTVYSTGGNAALSVVGDVISFGASNSDLSYFRRLGVGQFQWQTYNSGNNGEIHLQPYGGSVGIGTSSPSYKLDVRTGGQGDIASFRGSAYPITFATTGSTGNYYGTQMMMAADAGSTQAAFRLNTRYNSAVGSGVAFTIESSTNDQSYGQNPSALTYSEKFRITAGGNVGIGTVSPAYKLEVSGTGRFSGELTVAPSATNGITISRAGGYASIYGSNDLVFETDSVFYFGVYTPRLFSVNGSFYTTAGGNVGIGTGSPSYKLDVNGSSRFTQSINLDESAILKKKFTTGTSNPVKTASGVLTSRSDNGGGYTYYVIETNVPQDNYQMGGFTIELFGNYSGTNHKTKIDLGGYWNPEGNGGFVGFEAHGTNPQYKPTIEVARNSAGNTAFIIYGSGWNYPVIVARDLWLGYDGTDPGTYGEGWTISGTNDVSSYTNKDTVVWRNAYSDSNPAGYITGYSETDTLQSVTSRGSSTNTDMSIGGTGGDRGLLIYHGEYGRIRFYEGSTNLSTIHSFSTSWQSGNVLVSGGALNLTGNTGVTIGGWNVPDAVFRAGGSTYFRNNVGIGSDTPDSKLEVNGRVSIRGGNELHFGQSTSGIGSWTTRTYASGSTHKFNAQTFIFNNEGYGSYEHMALTANGVNLRGKNTIDSTDSWLRLNQSGDYGSGVYTPYVLRNDGVFYNYGGIEGYNTIKARKAQTVNNYTTAALWTESYDATTTGIAFHISGNVGKFLEMRTDGVLYWDNNIVIHSGNIGSQSVNYATSAGSASTATDGLRLLREDNRTISPSELTAGYLKFGFTSWSNDNSAPYADFLHMRSYTDASGGDDNLVMFKKSGIGMRIWQRAWGNSGAYSAYADVWTTENFTSTNVSNWNTAYGWGNHASQGYATTSYVTTQINNLINGAPGALDTLDELAAALGDDANFATTVTNSIAGKVSKSGDTITTSNQYGLVIDHSPAMGDFVDGLLIRSTTSGQRAQIGFATVDADGDHHRASIRAYKGTQTLEGVFGIALRQPGSGAHTQRLTLDYLGNLTIGGALTEASSLKLKENVETSEGNLEKVVNLRPVTYNKIGSQTTELGLIAEEVAEVYPEFVQYDENGEPVGVHYSRLTAALIGAVKQLTKRIETLENNG